MRRIVGKFTFIMLFQWRQSGKEEEERFATFKLLLKLSFCNKFKTVSWANPTKLHIYSFPILAVKIERL